MPVYHLTPRLEFPDPEWSNTDGLLAVGGDLSVNRLLLAYRLGIFPWYGPGYPILWWCPPQRCVLTPEEFHASRSLRRLLRQQYFQLTFDHAFGRVIRACAETRLQGGQETWITPDMLDAFCSLHDAGYAHSVEAWHGAQLAGGIYGVSLGRAFFGESMFTRVSNASKAAFFALAQRLASWHFLLIDCQILNPHLERLGAYEISRTTYLGRLAEALRYPARRGSWRMDPAESTTSLS